MLPPGLLDLSELEHRAVSFRAVEMLAVPGIFQTEEYARAIFVSGSPGVIDEDLDARIEHRVTRRRIFDRNSPPGCEAIVHEAALRVRYGSRKIVRAQLESLLESRCTRPRCSSAPPLPGRAPPQPGARHTAPMLTGSLRLHRNPDRAVVGLHGFPGSERA
ncbi:Scr1 family TA system antitoxin-like transcriptional regulator [Streptomyces sp. NPDC056987]|uniref:Scr1 family TA system antitoxin-like transcriptional regulator n=1 Tax=Streptomyces sp. NPDC056987 TaxID=3345988 RepID=UPI00362EFB5B